MDNKNLQLLIAAAFMALTLFAAYSIAAVFELDVPTTIIGYSVGILTGIAIATGWDGPK